MKKGRLEGRVRGIRVDEAAAGLGLQDEGNVHARVLETPDPLKLIGYETQELHICAPPLHGHGFQWFSAI